MPSKMKFRQIIARGRQKRAGATPADDAASRGRSPGCEITVRALLRKQKMNHRILSLTQVVLSLVAIYSVDAIYFVDAISAEEPTKRPPNLVLIFTDSK